MVSIKPHTIFTRQGTDIVIEMPVTFVQAALGAELTVPTIDGKVKYSIPEGTQSGTVFRIKGRGIPVLNSKSRGDQYVKINVEIPNNLSPQQKEILAKFDQEATDKNYQGRKSFFEKMKDLFN